MSEPASPAESNSSSALSSPAAFTWRRPSPKPSPPPASQIDLLSRPLYQYDPLPFNVDAIRLVRLRPADPSRPNLPVCSLETHFVDLHPPYCALSYSWGQPEETEEMIDDEDLRLKLENDHNGSQLFGAVLDGDMFPVRLNLVEFLTNMAKQLADPRFVGYDLFWIDAMCIDQQNLEERNEQVGMMGRIYLEADRVLVWLGEDGRNEMPQVKEMVYKLLDMDNAIGKEHGEPGLDWEEVWARADQQRHLDQAGLPYLDNEKWWSFCAFFRRSWFYRLWILQEVALAKEIVILCGSTEFEIIDLDRCAGVLRCGLDLKLAEKWARDRFNTFRPVARNLHRVCQILRWCQLKEDPISEIGGKWLRLALNGTASLSITGAIWMLLLNICDGAKLTEPVDNVYGLLGVVQYIAPDAPLPVHVDYSKGIEEVRVGIWSHIIDDTQWLNMLCRIQHLRSRILLPSWVPAFREYVGHFIYLGGVFNASLSLNEDDMATDLPGFAMTDEQELLLSGTKIGTITSVGQHYSGPLRRADEGVISIISTCPEIYEATGEPLIRAVWKTLVAWPLENEPSSYCERVEKLFQKHWIYEYANLLANKARETKIFDSGGPANVEEALRELLSSNCPHVSAFSVSGTRHGFPTVDRIVDETVHWKKIQDDRQQEMWEDQGHPIHTTYAANQEFRLMEGKYAAERRFFKTGNGYIGLGPDMMCEDDEVWLIPRTTVPIVLRPIYKYPAEEISDGKDAELREKHFHRDYKVPVYIVIGECYMHGVMQGELIKKKRAATDDAKAWDWQRILFV